MERGNRGVNSDPLSLRYSSLCSGTVSWKRQKSMWTPPPSFRCTHGAKDASHSIAAGDEQAMDLPPGTVSAGAAPGKCSSKTDR